MPTIMTYNRLGKSELMVSAVSLGTEYLIDIPADRVKGVIHAAIEAGINYFDVFWARPDFRNAMGAAFQGHREKVNLAAHLGSVHLDGQYKATRDPDKSAEFFDDFLSRYDTEYSDILFLHNSDGREDYEKIMEPGGLKDLALEYKKSGKTRFIGFSGHTVDTALDAVQSGVIDVLMFPVNIAGNSIKGRQELFRACATHDVGLVAMKIFAGGKLLGDWEAAEIDSFQLGSEKKTVTREAGVLLTPVKGIHYALSQIAVSTVVPGCKNVKELKTDLGYFDTTKNERDYAETITNIRQFKGGECVYCNHCLPCPQEIDIGATIRVLETSGDTADAAGKTRYGDLPTPASDCIECGDCEERCPFDVKVIEKMQQATTLFEN